MGFTESLVQASRLEWACVSEPDRRLVAGRAIIPGGLKELQREPLKLSEYAAARTVRAATALRLTCAAQDVIASAVTYARCGDTHPPPERERLRRLLHRAGLSGAEIVGVANALVWLPDTAAALASLGTKVSVYKTLERAIEWEVENLRIPT